MIKIVSVCRVMPVGLFLLSSSFCLASDPQISGVRKIVHPDGRVEYTNISEKPKQVIYTKGSVGSVSRIYTYQDENGVISFSDKSPEQGEYEVIRVKCYACDPESKVDWQHTRLNLAAYQSEVERAAAQHGVEPALVRALIHAESGFNPGAISSQGAVGLMQLMPATARHLGVTEPLDPGQNIKGGTRYIAQLIAQFNGDIPLACAAYNAGPSAVRQYKGIPPYRETQSYVKRVGILSERYRQALAKTD